MRTTHFVCGLSAALALACLAGCGKKEPQTPVQQESGAVTNAAPNAPAGPSIEAVVFERTLTFAEGRLAQKDYQGAREALAPLETQNLTAAQRSKLNALKRQIPQ
jgi:hypothetical protein